MAMLVSGRVTIGLEPTLKITLQTCLKTDNLSRKLKVSIQEYGIRIGRVTRTIGMYEPFQTAPRWYTNLMGVSFTIPNI